MSERLKLAEKYENNPEELKEKLAELVAPGGALEFIGEKNAWLFERGVRSAADGYFSAILSPHELAVRFSSRMTQEFLRHGEKGTMVSVFLEHPEKNMGDIARALSSAGIVEGLPDFGETFFPEGCFVSLVRNIRKDIPDLPDEIILEVCRELESHTFLGDTTVEVGYSSGDVEDWLESEGEDTSFRNYLLDKRLNEIDDDESTSWNLSYKIIDRIQDMQDFDLDSKDEDILRYAIYDAIREDYTLQSMESGNLRLNLLLAFGDELNSDMSNIEAMFSMISGNDEPTEEVVANNALTWLIHQQGYNLRDLVEGKQSVFLNSVREELANFFGGSAYLTVCCTSDVDRLSDMNIRTRTGEPIDLSPGAMLGIFSPDVGGGSVMGITLERPLVIPQEMVANIQIEGRKPSFGYSVDDVYGLVGSAWDAEIGPAATTVEPLTKLDVSEDMQVLKDVYAAEHAQDGPGM